MIINEKSHDYIANPGTVGAINELYVANDLMARGMSVFRSLSPSCKCDLIAMLQNGELKKVEVKTGYKTSANKIGHSPCEHSKFDWLAIVLGNPTKSGSIHYVNRDGKPAFDGDSVENISFIPEVKYTKNSL